MKKLYIDPSPTTSCRPSLKGRVVKTLCFLCLLCLYGCESFFFYPDETLIYHPDLVAHAPENVLFKSTDNVTLHGWVFNPSAAKPKGTILFLHGNGQNMSYHIHTVWWLVNAGYSVFTFDYRGYGVSSGEPTITGVHDDAAAALDLLLSNTDEDIIILGQSMGGAIAVYTAATTPHKDRVKALITDSAFSSWRDIAREKAGDLFITWAFQYPVGWTINDDFSPLEQIGKVDAKTLIIHNKHDKIIPSTHAETLYEASKGRAELLLTDYEGHVTAGMYTDIQKKVVDFLGRLEVE
jgi:pimeloyl-ACP methyl ester carboxylesterase